MVLWLIHIIWIRNSSQNTPNVKDPISPCKNHHDYSSKIFVLLFFYANLIMVSTNFPRIGVRLTGLSFPCSPLDPSLTIGITLATSSPLVGRLLLMTTYIGKVCNLIFDLFKHSQAYIIETQCLLNCQFIPGLHPSSDLCLTQTFWLWLLKFICIRRSIWKTPLQVKQVTYYSWKNLRSMHALPVFNTLVRQLF